MKKTLRNMVLGATLVGTLISVGCKEEERDSRLPVVRDNQQIILHPDYLQGSASLGYTLLTDIGYNGDWDVSERYNAGFTGHETHKFYIKKGATPAPPNVEVEYVEPEFFKPFE